MSARIGVVMLVVPLLALAGCTSVQKGAVAGAGAGSAVGGVAGHFTQWGGGPGALLGLGVGSGAGALAAEYYYGDDATTIAEVGGGHLDQLKEELDSSRAQREELERALEQEKAQQNALLEAAEQARAELTELRKELGEGVAVSGNANEITLTILSEVLFDSGDASLTDRGKSALRGACEAIAGQYPNAFLEIRGHTDNVPIKYSKFRSNWQLSCERALGVLEYMEAQGFAPERLAATGYGSTRPVASNDTPDGRRKNRRAEIVIRPRDLSVAEAKPLNFQ